MTGVFKRSRPCWDGKSNQINVWSWGLQVEDVLDRCKWRHESMIFRLCQKKANHYKAC